MKLISTFPT